MLTFAVRPAHKPHSPLKSAHPRRLARLMWQAFSLGFAARLGHGEHPRCATPSRAANAATTIRFKNGSWQRKRVVKTRSTFKQRWIGHFIPEKQHCSDWLKPVIIKRYILCSLTFPQACIRESYTWEGTAAATHPVRFLGGLWKEPPPNLDIAGKPAPTTSIFRDTAF